MRRPIIGAAVLGGVGLALFFLLRTPGPEPVPGTGEAASAVGQTQARAGQPGTVPQPESPEDVGAQGTAAVGSTPTLAKAPSEGDGVLEVEVVAGERPVPGASVRLYWRGPRDPNLDEVSWRLASTGTTDAQGRVQLASRPGGYLVAVHAQGHAPLLRDVVRPYGEPRTLLRLSLESGQALTGRTVVHGTKEPLPLVELILTAHGRKLEGLQRAEAPAEERVYAASDERGNFRVEGLAAGDYLLEARAAGHARAVLRRVTVPTASPLTVALHAAGVIEGFVVDAQGNPAEGAEVQVSGRVPEVTTTGSGGGFSVEVGPGAYTVSARLGGEAGSLEKPVVVSAGTTLRDVRIQLGQGAVLEGRVVARSTGAPVGGASVDVSPAGISGDSGRALTDGTGSFSVGGLAPGSYDLVVTAPGFSTLTRPALTVASGERFPVELQLVGTGTVEGQVKDGAGVPVSGVHVAGGSRWAGMLGSTPAESRTDALGNYRLEGLATGTQRVTVRREGAALGKSARVEVTEGGTSRLDFTLDELGTVEGVVRAASGSLPAEPLLVNAFLQEQERFTGTDAGRIEVDTAGTFRMLLPAGLYALHAIPTERWSPMTTRRSPARVQVEPGKTVKAELTWDGDTGKASSLQGRVLEPDGSPSVGAFITLSAENGPGGMPSMGPSDEEGRFTLSLPPRAGSTPVTLRVSARNGGRSGVLQGVRYDEREVVVKLRPAASVRGRVVRASGSAPVKGFTVSVSVQTQGRGFFPGGAGPREFPGDRFELRDVPAEPVKLVVRTVDGAAGEVLTSPGAGEATEVEISVRATAGVRGRLVDATTKAPVSHAMVFIEGERSPSLDEGTKDDGRFFLEGVSPGERKLTIMPRPPRRRERRTVALVEGQVLELGDVTLSSPGMTPGTIGAMVIQEGPQLTFNMVVPESPAAKAGLLVGDALLAVDGVPVTSPYEAFVKLRGAPGSTVVLTVRRAGSERSVSITRAP
jgi:hypothetical protein